LITSDRFSEDTDGDGFTDNVEKQLVLDPVTRTPTTTC
jgi:hypothetical protein